MVDRSEPVAVQRNVVAFLCRIAGGQDRTSYGVFRGDDVPIGEEAGVMERQRNVGDISVGLVVKDFHRGADTLVRAASGRLTAAAELLNALEQFPGNEHVHL